MSATDPLEPDPVQPVISVSTTEISTTATGALLNPLPPAGSPNGTTTAVNAPGPGFSPAPDDSEGPEAEVWQSRYALGNFAGRFILGALMLAGTAVLAYYGYEANDGWARPLFILLGLATVLFWIWLAFRIVRAHFSHHYRLTTRRLFVTVGIFRRRQDIMELQHLKEVTLQQQKMLDHVFKLGTVVVTSNVSGAPTLFLLGVKYPQQISDQIYFHARN